MSILDKMGRKSPTVSIKRPFYTMATVDGDAAEIVMYGDVVESQPVDPWTGEPIRGNYIIESEFLDDLQQVSNCKSITIRMNSCGGDAGVAVLIHNRGSRPTKTMPTTNPRCPFTPGKPDCRIPC